MYCGVVIGSELAEEDPDVQKSMTHVRFALDTARTTLKNNIWFYDTELHETEILEGLAAENAGVLNEKILRLKELGLRISMDDFGSGYSSLNTLAGLKIDELKFDRDFLLRLDDKEVDRSRQLVIMNEIVELTKKLNIRTVAEGVETKEHEELIRSFGCGYGQGYYYGRPVSAEVFSEKYLGQKSA